MARHYNGVTIAKYEAWGCVDDDGRIRDVTVYDSRGRMVYSNRLMRLISKNGFCGIRDMASRLPRMLGLRGRRRPTEWQCQGLDNNGKYLYLMLVF